MNTRPIIDETAKPAALSASFNADNSFFSIPHETGFRVLSSSRCELFKSHTSNSGLSHAEMLESTQYMALVGGGKQPQFPPNKVAIWDAAKKTTICKMEFQSPVLGVRICRTHIVVVLLNTVNLYQFSSPPQKLAVFDTANNPLGLCCLGTETIVFPGRTFGQVQLVELRTRNVSIISSHEAPLRALAISPDGAVLATASETGTLIRVWSTKTGTRLGELRRGVDAAIIFSMGIDPSSSLLAVTSDKSTLHVFDLPHPTRSSSKTAPSSSSSAQHDISSSSASPDDSGPPQKWGMLARIPLMPRVFKDVYSFASAHFEIGEEPSMWQHGPTHRRSTSKDDDGHGVSNATSPISPGAFNPNSAYGGKPPVKGLIGWTSEEELVVVGAGEDARWEKFWVGHNEEGRRVAVRLAWKRYMYL